METSPDICGYKIGHQCEDRIILEVMALAAEDGRDVSSRKGSFRSVECNQIRRRNLTVPKVKGKGRTETHSTAEDGSEVQRSVGCNGKYCVCMHVEASMPPILLYREIQLILKDVRVGG